MALFNYFDRDHNGKVSFDEFLRTFRGRMSPIRRKLVIRIFDLLDRAGDGNGTLSVEDIRNSYSAKDNPEVRAGRITVTEALNDFLDAFEGDGGNHDGTVTLDEWTRYYEDLSASIDSDDYFGEMLERTWRALQVETPGGRKTPAVRYISTSRITELEHVLRRAIFARLRRGAASEAKAVRAAFKVLDVSGDGTVSFDEFKRAMSHYGLEPTANDARQRGGVTEEELRALFDKYDAEGDGKLSYDEFAAGLYPDGDQPTPSATSLPLGKEMGDMGISPTHIGGFARPGSAASYTRGISLANSRPMSARDPDAYKKSSGIFR